MAAVIFDVDGTLIDSVDLHARSWVETLAHFGFEASFEDVRANIGKGGDQLAPSFVPPQELARRKDDIEAWRGELFKREYLPQVTAFPAVRELFERIRADGRAIAVASSSKADEVERYLSIAKVADLVDVATSSDDAERSKPFPDIFQAALARLGEPGSAAFVIGDTPYDAEAARAAQARSIGVLCGGFTRESLEAAGAIAVFQDPQDLLTRFGQSPLARAGG